MNPVSPNSPLPRSLSLLQLLSLAAALHFACIVPASAQITSDEPQQPSTLPSDAAVTTDGGTDIAPGADAPVGQPAESDVEIRNREREKRRSEKIATLLARADEHARKRQPEGARGRRGEGDPDREEEAKALLFAAMIGDRSRDERRTELVREIRTDASVPVERRSRIAAMADNLEVQRRSGLSREDRLEEQERVVRNLIQEFPEVPTGYESLLSIALARSAEHGRDVAAEILNMPAPEFVKEKARTVTDAPPPGSPDAPAAPATTPDDKAATSDATPNA